MSNIKESIQVNVQGAILGVQEGGFSFVNEFKRMPAWRKWVCLFIAIIVIPLYLIVRVGTEQFLTQKYGRLALSAHAAFNTAQLPVVGNMTIVRNPNNSYSGVAQVTNPNLDLAATNISYTATFQISGKSDTVTSTGTMYLLPNEKKYVVFPKIEAKDQVVTGGKLVLGEVKWQNKLKIPSVKLRATEPILYDESNPLQFIAEGSIINDSPYQIAAARIVFLLYDESNNIIGVSQRDEYKLVPFGRRAYKQLWPGVYRSQVKKVQVLPATNALDPLNITTDPNNASPT